ncbi:bifunctional DNA primase/polymerase [Streptomyces sp. ST2-7A]|uniref:bifunctional DNA primase/polymerase n=1 Tax=Streptomyces sp. ST2-7A TaxID=2907214 RepID=UPI001F21098C|nr:bifunctional DNA primase/polymerase [Streptomyces sp. ST2-7A]MCE7080714.1 bifunctional DNA primase/polymerase [Streptomyces sp. ST2-7A]
MTHDPRSALLRAALEAAERGWPVFPLRPGTKRPALHREDRCPATGPCAAGHLKWEQRATTDPARIRAAWSSRPFNVGIATGPAGLVVIDLDRPKNGSDTPCGVTTFRALCERAAQPVPDTYRVRTASGGEHLYFTAPEGARLGNTAGTIGELVDSRAWGGYVVAAGSTTDTGAYEAVGDRGAAPLPEWLHTVLKPAPTRPGGPLGLPAVDGSRAALAALRAECAAVAASPDKQRNTTLNRCAFKVGRFVAWGDIPRHVVEEAFQGAGEGRGLTAAECRATIRSALDSSIRKARPREAA